MASRLDAIHSGGYRVQTPVLPQSAPRPAAGQVQRSPLQGTPLDGTPTAVTDRERPR